MKKIIDIMHAALKLTREDFWHPHPPTDPDEQPLSDRQQVPTVTLVLNSTEI